MGEVHEVKGEEEYGKESECYQSVKIYPMPLPTKENITVLGCQLEMDDRDTLSV